MTQTLDLNDILNQEENLLKFELSAYLGGFENQEDTASFTVIFMTANGDEIQKETIDGPNFSERNNKTTLILNELSGNIPVGTSKVKFVLETHGKHGYADNLSFKIIKLNLD